MIKKPRMLQQERISGMGWDSHAVHALTRELLVGIRVVLSPTKEGRIWDIQLDIIAIVLRRAPSVRSGESILGS